MNVDAHQPSLRLASVIRRSLFSTDHKAVGKQYLITAFLMGLLAMGLSWVLRAQLGWQTGMPAWMSNLLARLFPHGAEGGVIKPDFYLAVVTIHGTLMIFFVITATTSAAFGNFLLPLQVGARDMAFPVLSLISYWIYLASCGVLVTSFFVTGGPAASGWTSYPPLSVLPQAAPGSGLGQTLWLASIALFILSSLLGSLNFITTVVMLRAPGMVVSRLPLTVWSLLVAALMALLSFPVLLAAVVLLLLDRSLGTSFFVPGGLVVGGQPVTHQGGNPILWQHLFWFLGHPEVYIAILPVMGVVSEVLACHARKPIFGYRSMVAAIGAIGFLSFIVWGHHMFVSGMNPFLGTAFMLTTLVIAVPSAVKTFNWLATLWRGSLRFTTAMLFALGFISFFVSGGLTGLALGNPPIDLQVHDTYFVVAHFHLVMGSASIFGIFAGLYHWFPKMAGRLLSEAWGRLHFWLTFVGTYLVFFPMYFMGLAGMPRRYYAHVDYTAWAGFLPLNRLISLAAFAVGAAQLIFVLNVLLSLRWGRLAGRNPWGATTLEWTAESPPPTGNWGRSSPVVYRGAYDYSLPDAPRDYLMQTEPDP